MDKGGGTWITQITSDMEGYCRLGLLIDYIVKVAIIYNYIQGIARLLLIKMAGSTASPITPR